MTNNQVLNNNRLDPIEREIFQAVSLAIKDYWQFWEKPEERKKQKWLTRQIKDRVGELGVSKGMGVSSFGEEGEWLYDLVWYRNNEAGHLRDVPLVLESEMSTRSLDGLKWDFEKLLVANADHRVFICYHQGNYSFPNNINNLFSFFDTMVQTYHGLSLGERVMVLICADYHDGILYPHSIVKR